MTLPNTVIDVNTATWSDHKNQSHGGAQRVATSTAVNHASFYSLGDTSQYVGLVGGSFVGEGGHKFIRMHCYLQRVGSPSGNVFVQFRPRDPATAIKPDMTTVSATSISVPASSIPTTAITEVIFSFPIPPTLPPDITTAFALTLTISTQGDSSNYIKVHRGTNGDHGGSQAYGSSTWNVDGSGLSLSKVMAISKSGARVITVDKTNNQAKSYKTDDNAGSSWSNEGSGSITTTANQKSVGTQVGVGDLGTTYFTHVRLTANNVGIYKRNETTGPTLDPSTAVSFTTLNNNVSGTAPVFGGRRVTGAVLVAQGATETVMGSGRRRIKLAFHDGASWSALFDVAGSANTPDATLPGDAVDYDLRWAALDINGDFHIVYSKSDTSTLQYRKFKSDNTFTTINTLNGAVASATANYPVGQGTFVYKAPDWYIVVPYVDNSSSTLKEARCKTTTSETSANWTLTQIVAANAETSGSNPAVLIADNGQGGKVYCWRVIPTTKGLRMTHDGGNSTWVAETDWRGATQVVGGISGFYVEDGIALVYLEEGTTPDEVRYDRL